MATVVTVPLPENIPEDVLEFLGHLAQDLERIEEARGDLDAALASRDQRIAELRQMGWTVDQVATYTGLSIGAIRKISKQQGVVSQRVALIDRSADATV